MADDDKKKTKKKAAITIAIAISVPALTEVVIALIKIGSVVLREFLR